MRKIAEITHNGKPLQEILDAHKIWATTDATKGRADLRDANLRGADLFGAYLRGADLFDADLFGADLRGADLDYSCWPLSCKSKNVKVDARIAAQLAAHFCVLDCDDPAYQAARSAILEFAKTSHRAGDLGLLAG